MTEQEIKELIENPEHILTSDQLSEIALWVIDEYNEKDYIQKGFEHKYIIEDTGVYSGVFIQLLNQDYGWTLTLNTEEEYIIGEDVRLPINYQTAHFINEHFRNKYYKMIKRSPY